MSLYHFLFQVMWYHLFEAVVIGIILIIGAYHLWRQLNIVKLYRGIPGLKVYSLLGNLSLIPIAKSGKHLNSNVNIYQILSGLGHLFIKEKMACITILNYRFLVFYKPQSIQDILSNVDLIEKADHYKFLTPWLGDSIVMVADKTKWAATKRIVMPAFHANALKRYLPVINNQCKVLVKILKETSQKKWTDITPIFTHWAFDIVCETSLRIKVGAQENDSEVCEAVTSILKTTIERSASPLHWNDTLFNYTSMGKKYRRSLSFIQGFVRDVIKKRKEKMEMEMENGISANTLSDRKTLSIVDLLVHKHITEGTITEEDIMYEICTLLFAGYDTVKGAVSWAMYLIGLHPDVQTKLREELSDIFDCEREVTMEDLKKMKYMECVFKESQRLYPAVFIGRKLKKGSVIDGFTLPTESDCCIFIQMLHRNPEIYPNPEIFDPERFLPENCKDRHPYAFVPFCGGIRPCLGKKIAIMEAKCAMAYMLRKFTFTSLDHRDKVPVASVVISTPSKELRMKVQEI